jgi:hypothetical protein
VKSGPDERGAGDDWGRQWLTLTDGLAVGYVELAMALGVEPDALAPAPSTGVPAGPRRAMDRQISMGGKRDRTSHLILAVSLVRFPWCRCSTLNCGRYRWTSPRFFFSFFFFFGTRGGGSLVVGTSNNSSNDSK